MMGSTIKHIPSYSDPRLQSLSTLIRLIETEYPDEDTDNVDNLIRLLKEEFDIEYTKEEIGGHYLVEIEAEDMKLQHKHLNIRI